VHVSPAGEHCDIGKEEEDMSPLGLLKIKRVGHVHDQHAQDYKEESQPWQEKVPLPGSDAMTCQAVYQSRDGGEHPKESSKHDHPVFVLQLVGQRHGDQGDSRDQIADVKKEETSEKGVCGSEDSCSLLVAPDGP